MSTRTTIRFPPIQPEQDILPVFSALTDHLHALEKKYDQVMHGSVSYDRRSLLSKLEKLRHKIYILIGLLQSMQLGMVVFSYPVQISQEVPRNIKSRMQPLLQHLRTLDRRVYRGFFRSIARKTKEIQRQAIDLDNKVQQTIDSLRPIQQQQPRMLIQRTTTIPIQSNQLLPPPVLRRSYNM